MSYCGGVHEVFDATRSKLLKVPSIGQLVVKNLNLDEALQSAEVEVEFIRKNKIRPIFFLDNDYPTRLKHCEDGPLMLYTKGGCDLNPEKVLAIVGTRNITDYA